MFPGNVYLIRVGFVVVLGSRYWSLVGRPTSRSCVGTYIRPSEDILDWYREIKLVSTIGISMLIGLPMYKVQYRKDNSYLFPMTSS